MIRLPRTRLGMVSYILSVAILTFSLFATVNTPAPKKQVLAPSPTPLAQIPQKDTVLGESTEQTFLVTRVIDGDTFEIAGGKKIRMIGINTPESVASGKAVECYALEASLKTKELLEGNYVRLVKDVSETDYFGRLLRYVYVGDQFINKILVWEGYARARSYPPDITHQPELKSAEQEAFREKKGLWGEVCQ